METGVLGDSSGDAGSYSSSRGEAAVPRSPGKGDGVVNFVEMFFDILINERRWLFE